MWWDLVDSQKGSPESTTKVLTHAGNTEWRQGALSFRAFSYHSHSKHSITQPRLWFRLYVAMHHLVWNHSVYSKSKQAWQIWYCVFQTCLHYGQLPVIVSLTWVLDVDRVCFVGVITKNIFSARWQKQCLMSHEDWNLYVGFIVTSWLSIW